MLKLSKYEFRKNRNFLIIIGAGLLLLQIYFMISTFVKNTDHTVISSSLLFLYAMICYFAVFILAVSNYSKELNSKSSYLIFMTPNSALNIIFSKIFTILIIGLVLLILICGFGYLDITLVYKTYPDVGDITNFANEFMKMLGINTGELILSILASILEFIISFFSVVMLSYLAITLSATLLQNNKFKGIVSFVIFLILTYLTTFIVGKLPVIYDNPENMLQVFTTTLPATILDVIIIAASILGCSVLLEKKVSL